MTIQRKLITVGQPKILFRGDKYFIYFIKNINGLNTILKREKVNLTQTFISYKKRTYPINTANVVYRNRNLFYGFIDIDKGQINFGEKQSSLNPEFLDFVVKQKIGKQLVQNLDKVVSIGFLNILLYIAVGIAFGYIIGNVFPMP